MYRRAIRPSWLLLTTWAVATACGGPAVQLDAARAASYDGERAAVFRDLVAAVAADYAKGLEVDEADGLVKTAWYALKVRDSATGRDENVAAGGGVPSAARRGDSGGSIGAGPQPNSPREPVSSPTKISFVRFDVRLVGGPPWRVEVGGFASEYDHTSGKPMPLEGADRPYWLDGRQKKLEIAIYERLRKYERKPAK